MNFTEAVAEVLSIVKRPDKILDIRREVNAAVNFYSQDADWARDVEEVLLSIDAQAYSQNLPYTGFTRFRKIHFIKQAGTIKYLKELEPRKITTQCDIRDKYYLAGSGIRINMSSLAASLDIGYFQFPPNLTDAAGTYWMLDSAPYMIIDKAAALVFNNIGDQASAQIHGSNASLAYLAFRAANKHYP